MPENLMQMLLGIPTRKENEEKITNFVAASGFIDLNPKIETHLGTIDLVCYSYFKNKAYLAEEINKDWHYKGTLDQLTDEEFEKVFAAVRDFAEKVLAMAR